MLTNQLLGFSFFGTMKHGKTGAASLEPAAKQKPIAFPSPDGVLTFDRLSSVFFGIDLCPAHQRRTGEEAEICGRADYRCFTRGPSGLIHLDS